MAHNPIERPARPLTPPRNNIRRQRIEYNEGARYFIHDALRHMLTNNTFTKEERLTIVERLDADELHMLNLSGVARSPIQSKLSLFRAVPIDPERVSSKRRRSVENEEPFNSDLVEKGFRLTTEENFFFMLKVNPPPFNVLLCNPQNNRHESIETIQNYIQNMEERLIRIGHFRLQTTNALVEWINEMFNYAETQAIHGKLLTGQASLLALMEHQQDVYQQHLIYANTALAEARREEEDALERANHFGI